MGCGLCKVSQYPEPANIQYSKISLTVRAVILHCSSEVELKDLQDLLVQRLSLLFQWGSLSVSAGKAVPGMRVEKK